MSRQTVWSYVLPRGTLTRDIKLICVSNFIGAFGDGLFVYVLPIYIRGLQATAADVGLLYSILGLSTALTIIPGGLLADRFDRKKVMILGWLVWVPIPLMMAAATHWSHLILPMVLYGFFLSGPATSAYVATSADRQRITLTFAAVSASWALGYIFSPGLGGYLATVTGMQLVFTLAFMLYSIATGLIFFVASQHAAKPRVSVQVSSKDDSPAVRRIILLSVFFAVALFFMSMVRPLVVQFQQEIFKLDTFPIGVLGSWAFLGWALFSIMFGRIGDRWSKMVAVALSMIVTSFSLWLLTAFNNFALLSLASFLSGASYLLWYLMNASVGVITPEASRGRWISFSQVIATLAIFVAPYLGGVLYETNAHTPFYIAIAVSPVLAIVALAKTFRET